MSRRLIPLFIAVAAVVALLVSTAIATAGPTAAPATQRHYPPAVRAAFMRSCTTTARAVAGSRITRTQARQYCASALACIERRLTLSQFARVVQNMRAGRPNPNARVLTSCERAAIKKVLG